jgi:hypothetical protein
MIDNSGFFVVYSFYCYIDSCHYLLFILWLKLFRPLCPSSHLCLHSDVRQFHFTLSSVQLCGTTINIWLRPVQEDLSMTACLEHSASNLWPLAPGYRCSPHPLTWISVVCEKYKSSNTLCLLFTFKVLNILVWDLFFISTDWFGVLIILFSVGLSLQIPPGSLHTNFWIFFTFKVLLTYLLMWHYNQYLVKACPRRCFHSHLDLGLPWFLFPMGLALNRAFCGRSSGVLIMSPA